MSGCSRFVLGRVRTAGLTGQLASMLSIVQLLQHHGCMPGSSVHGISQARIMEWVAISFSRESALPRH